MGDRAVGIGMTTTRRTHHVTEAQLHQCAQDGLTSRQAATVLRIPLSSLRATAAVLGIRYAVNANETTTVAMIRQCAALGMSARQAADQLGVSQSNLRTAAGVLGIRFCGHSGNVPNRVTLHRQSAHDPFGMLFR